MPLPKKTAILFAVALANFGTSAQAATTPSQVRVAISPAANDPVWKTPGIKFEKVIECKVVKSTSPNPAFPAPADVLSTGEAKAPLFNPGLPKPDGTYSATPSNGDNTIFVPLNLAVDPNSYVACAGRILANGVNVTAASRAGLTYATIMKIGGTGPIGVSPRLDPTSLQALVAKMPKRGSFELVFHYYPAGGPSGPVNRFDLDTQKSIPFSQADTGGDLTYKFTVDNDPSATFNIANGARFSDAKRVPGIPTVPAPEPAQSSCASQQLVLQWLTLYTKSKPEFLCMRTSEGKIAAINLRGLSRDTTYKANDPKATLVTAKAKFDYVVWPN